MRLIHFRVEQVLHINGGLELACGLEELCLKLQSCAQGCDDTEALEGAASQLREYLEEVEVNEEEALFEVGALSTFGNHNQSYAGC